MTDREQLEARCRMRDYQDRQADLTGQPRRSTDAITNALLDIRQEIRQLEGRIDEVETSLPDDMTITGLRSDLDDLSGRVEDLGA